MSRLIVKNLPKNIKEEKLRETFSEKGVITDLKMCYTKSGTFRKFCFVGFKTEAEAKSALKHFHKSFIDTSKISVEFAKDLGDNEVPRPWSKYSKGSSAHEIWSKTKEERLQLVKKLQDEQAESPKHKSKGKKKDGKGKSDKIETLEKNKESDEEELQEFMEAHQAKSKKQTWKNETIHEEEEKKPKKKKTSKLKKDEVQFEDASLSGDEGAGGEEETVAEIKEKDPIAKKSNRNDGKDDKKTSGKDDTKVSDLAWLKSKVVKTKGESSPLCGSSTETGPSPAEVGEDSDDGESDSEMPDVSEEMTTLSDGSHSITIKMRGLPFKCKEKEIIEFFKPLVIVDIRMPLNEEEKPTGNAYVDFGSPGDAQKAMQYNNDYMKGRYIELFPTHGPMGKESETGKASRPWESKHGDDDVEEPISESGRLFIRNLSYLCAEDDIELLFGKYGPLSEVFLPLDKKTSKTTGIGFVTYLMPENAMKAFNALDGTVFQGRMLHVLPAKAKDSGGGTYQVVGPSSSYKRSKEKKDQSLSASDHNWNSLFLGQNAVAELMADRLNTTKSGILDAESGQSLAVRLALGETQVVSETRDFLALQGVKLDVLGQTITKRSKTVLLAKNLPHGTSAGELRDVFSKFGELGRVVLPPAGMTAIVEFLTPQEAKKAFQNLAYTKFKHVPLYLEWAAIDLLEECPETNESTVEATKVDEEKSEQGKDEGDKSSGEDDEEMEAEEGSVLFVKNLNFDSTEETLRKVFEECGKVVTFTIAKKKNPRDASSLLSMGYGFVEYRKKAEAHDALKTLQHVKVDGHQLELKTSQRQTLAPKASKKQAKAKKQTTTKILVRNVPFEASRKELLELFSTFGEIKTLRLPSKVAGTGTHRGFAFVDFLTKQDAKRAFKALCQSTHLYGRRLVLEWADNEESVDAIRIRTAKHFQSEGPAKKKSRNDMLDELDRTESAS